MHQMQPPQCRDLVRQDVPKIDRVVHPQERRRVPQGGRSRQALNQPAPPGSRLLRQRAHGRAFHRGNHRRTAVHEATAALPVLPISDRPYASPEELSAAESEAFDTEYALSEDVPPVEIRRKSFPAERMSADQAIDRMELVGHDFFLYIDSATDEPSVAYRRKGWEYGVISLSASVAEPETVEERAYQAS